MEDELAVLERLMREAFLGNTKTQQSHRSVTTAFKYEAFTNNHSIRLVRLKAGRRWDALRATLEEIEIEHLPSYEALSYAWGDSRKPYNIWIGSASMAITASLHEALQRLRLVSEERLLWIDAACIDQSNNAEKTQQIGLMPDIYTRARKVLCWLGEDDSNQTAWNSIQLVKKIGNIDFQQSLRYHDKAAWRVSQGLPPPEHKRWIDYMKFWARPYFRRRWIIQEVANAKSAILVLGERQEPWTNLLAGARSAGEQFLLEQHLEFRFPDDPIEITRRAALGGSNIFCSISSIQRLDMEESDLAGWMRQIMTGATSESSSLASEVMTRYPAASAMKPLLDPIGGLMSSLMADDDSDEVQELIENAINEAVQKSRPLMQFAKDMHKRSRLPDLLARFSPSEASDPRDRLFALLNLSSDQQNADLKPDYDESVAQVMMRYVMCFIEDEKYGMDMLCNAGLSYRVDMQGAPTAEFLQSLPSWVPDWMTSASQTSFMLKQHQLWSNSDQSNNDHSAARKLPPRLRLSTDRTKLISRGSILDTITELIERDDVKDKGMRAILEYWKKADALFDQKYPSYPFVNQGGVRETQAEMQCKTLIANYRTRTGLSQASWDESYSQCRAYLRHMDDAMSLYDAGVLSQSQIENVLKATRRDERLEALDDYFNRWFALTITHQLIGTRRGLVGIVPRGTKIGDLVVLLNGCPISFIIRSHDSGSYQLIGGAYIHGIMHGEALESDWWKEQDIVLV